MFGPRLPVADVQETGGYEVFYMAFSGFFKNFEASKWLNVTSDLKFIVQIPFNTTLHLFCLFWNSFIYC